MNFFKFLDKLKRSYNSLILYCLLDRVPIIVLGDNSEKIDEFLIELSELIHFRKEYIFYTDFISKNEYENLISNESLDYNYQRGHIRCPSSVSRKALSQFGNINSWLIGIEIPKEKDELFNLKKKINEKADKLIYITMQSNTISLEIIRMNLKSINLTLEQNIFKKISQDYETDSEIFLKKLPCKLRTSKTSNCSIQSGISFISLKLKLRCFKFFIPQIFLLFFPKYQNIRKISFL